MDAGHLDVLHDPGDVDVLAVGKRVDVDLDRVLEETIGRSGCSWSALTSAFS